MHIILSPSRPLNSVRYDLSKKERVSEFDDAEAAVVPSHLADDEAFLVKAEVVASAPEADRDAVAQREAAAYTEYRGPARNEVAGYLLKAAEKPWRKYFRSEPSDRAEAAARRDYFANLSRRAVWAEAELDNTDARRRKPRWAKLQEGALRFARRGAGECVECGTTLSERYIYIGLSRRRTRRERCSACEVLPDLYPGSIRDALEAWTRMRQRHRAARRAPI